jgi:hypothetical protein
MKSIRRRVAPVLALALGLGVLAAGCGSDDSGSSSDALTRAELTTQATMICRPVADAVNQALGKVFGNPKAGPDDFAAAVTSTVEPQFTKQTAALAELTPPSDLSDQYASYIDSAHAVSDQLQSDPAGPFTGDPAKFFGDSNAKATEAGLPKVCLAGPAGG